MNRMCICIEWMELNRKQQRIEEMKIFWGVTLNRLILIPLSLFGDVHVGSILRGSMGDSHSQRTNNKREPSK